MQSSGESRRENADAPTLFENTVSSRHCEERSDEAIHASASGKMDCFASLAITGRALCP